jgi:hypothetical protein
MTGHAAKSTELKVAVRVVELMGMVILTGERALSLRRRAKSGNFPKSTATSQSRDRIRYSTSATMVTKEYAFTCCTYRILASDSVVAITALVLTKNPENRYPYLNTAKGSCSDFLSQSSDYPSPQISTNLTPAVAANLPHNWWNARD